MYLYSTDASDGLRRATRNDVAGGLKLNLLQGLILEVTEPDFALSSGIEARSEAKKFACNVVMVARDFHALTISRPLLAIATVKETDDVTVVDKA